MGSLKMVAGIVVMVASVYLIAVLAPPFFSNYQFEDAIRTEAQMDTYNTKTEDQIRDAVFKKAQELDVPVSREQIKVQRSGVTGSGSISHRGALHRAYQPAGLPYGSRLRPEHQKQGSYVKGRRWKSPDATGTWKPTPLTSVLLFPDLLVTYHSEVIA